MSRFTCSEAWAIIAAAFMEPAPRPLCDTVVVFKGERIEVNTRWGLCTAVSSLVDAGVVSERYEGEMSDEAWNLFSPCEGDTFLGSERYRSSFFWTHPANLTPRERRLSRDARATAAAFLAAGAKT